MNIKERVAEGVLSAHLLWQRKKWQIEAKVGPLRDIDPERVRPWLLSSAMLNLVVAASLINPADIPAPPSVEVGVPTAGATPPAPPVTEAVSPAPPEPAPPPPVPFSQKPFPLQLPPEDKVKPPEPEPIAIPWLPDTINPWKPLLIEISKRHDFDPELAAIVTLVECAGNPGARSRVGARGLMQIYPPTGVLIAQAKGLATYDLYDPATNIDFGITHFKGLMNSVRKLSAERGLNLDEAAVVDYAAAAYNGGFDEVHDLLSGGFVPAESLTYRNYVGGMWKERHNPTSATYDTWLADGGAKGIERARQVLREQGLLPAA